MEVTPNSLTNDQLHIINSSLNSKQFLSGVAGTGKTTAGVERVLHLLQKGIPGNEILILLPQRTLATPYFNALQNRKIPPGSVVNILTIGGLARRMVDLFWPLIAEEAGFANPENPPIFLTLETAQYYMAHLVRPLLTEGFFESLTLDRNRLYSQILDNLSKSAVNGFSYTEISERMKSAWIGEKAQEHIFDDAQMCANKFRQYCLENNLLDFSLQLEVFLQHLWSSPLCFETITGRYKHLVFDNIEEATPVTTDLIHEWLPHFESSLLIYDEEAGYRRFLGADPDLAFSLIDDCEIQIEFTSGFVNSNAMRRFGSALAKALNSPQSHHPTLNESEDSNGTGETVPIHFPQPGIRFYPDMLNWVAEKISTLIENGTQPGEIVVLAPYLSDALRYPLVNRLSNQGIPTRSHRPSRSLREETAIQCMLNLVKLVYPSWGFIPTPSEFAHALTQAISSMDLIRAQLLTKIVYRKGNLSSFDDIKPELQERITYTLGERYENLRLWLANESEGKEIELDHFLSRLFGEVLSQPGFGFHDDYQSGIASANLIESAEKFRQIAGTPLAAEGVLIGREFLLMIEEGVIAAQYLRPWQVSEDDAVYIAPAYTYLMSNHPVDFQFWLDTGSRGWYERLYQPLTHPYVLSRSWIVGNLWTDIDEEATAKESLYRLTAGLIHRCRRGIFLGISEMGEQGYEHKGELLRAIDRVLQDPDYSTNNKKQYE